MSQPWRRRTPFIHVTNVARYLSDADACGYAAHFKAHYQYTKPPFDNPEWLVAHDALVAQQAAALRREGYTVGVEQDNDLRLAGSVSGVIVAGRPDIIGRAVDKGHELIIECKTGMPRPADVIQARLYLLLLPYVRPHDLAPQLAAQVLYRTGDILDVPPIDDDFRRQFRAAVATLAAVDAPPTRPGARTCSFCDIPGCASRIELADLAVSAAPSLFL